jgi:predicted nucleic acid-binding protein
VAGVSGSLLDTSVLIASDPEARLDLPETAAISIMTVGELHAGVQLARDGATRAARARRLGRVRATFVPIDVDARVAECYGDVLAAARREGRTVTATDVLIIATARATQRELVTLDERRTKLAAAIGQPVRVP